MKKLTLLLLLLPILVSCTSSRQVAISSIEDINTENDRGLPFINFDQQRSIHTGALLPHYSIGQMYVPPSSFSSFSPSKYIAVSDKPYYFTRDINGNMVEVIDSNYKTMSPAEQKSVIRGTKSQVATATYTGKATPQQITAIVSQLSDLKVKGLTYLNTRLDAAILNNHIAEKKQLEADNLARPNQKNSARLAELNKLIGTRTEADAKKLITTAQTELAKAEKLFADSANKENLILARWNSESSKAFLTYLSSLLTLDFNRKENKSGYVILNGVRVSTLILGTDIHHESYTTTLNWSRPVVTALWQTQSAVAVADLEIEEEVKAKLDASYDQLKHLEKALRDLEKIEIKATFKNLQKLTNNSWIKAPEIDVVDLEWTTISEKMEQNPQDGWATFYAILSNHSDLKEKVDGGKWQKVRTILNHANPF